MPKVLLDRAGLAALISALARRGFTVIGPKVTGTAITYQPITSIDDLPRGWKSVQSAGRYRLAPRDDNRLFAYGPTFESLKRFLRPPIEPLWAATRKNGTLQFDPVEAPPSKIAVLGVRPCELEAIARLDKVFLSGSPDPSYGARRSRLLLVAANCTEPGDTCFCSSTHTGPRASSLYDVALTELTGERFVALAGTDVGRDLLAEIGAPDASQAALDEARYALARAADRMGRQVDVDALPTRMASALIHPEWDDVARRCLACANCTMVCPTCFCHTVDDGTSLSGDRVSRERRWDTCFGAEFSYIHGGSIRPSVAARYRQWLTHKFAGWIQQFGTTGCVGCGRCITWCPAGIDVTEELRRVTQ